MSTKPPTLLTRANTEFRNKDLDAAMALYEEALIEAGEPLKPYIRFNRDLALRRLGREPAFASCLLEKPVSLDSFFFDLIKEQGLFNPVWYLDQYGKKYHVLGNPLAHYLDHGVELSTNPSLEFDTVYYLKNNPDVAQSGMHPFLHYTCQGHKEARRPTHSESRGTLSIYQVEAPQYLPRLPLATPDVKKSVRAIAFYLPQFHPIPENDAWWGKGFTEWTNVRSAMPLFDGHYQPHVPDDDLGYYDLRDTSVMRKQIEIAKQYGVEGFCFYVYWFSGKRLLEMPVDNYLADPKLDHPFCVCWANENWSRRWDGSEHEILMGQNYSDEHDLEFIADIAKYLRDPRYIHVEGKLLLIIYRPNLFPDMAKTAGRWRKWCRDNGLGELFIAYVQSFDNSPPDKYALDAAIEFPPSGWYAPPEAIEDIDPNPGFSGRLLEWRHLVRRSDTYDTTEPWVLRGACPSWDNTARRKGAATIFHRSSPKLFKRWLLNAFSDTINRIAVPDKRLVFINAWNEWAEGAHLEPDKRYGYAWLDAVRYAHLAAVKSSIAIVTHDAFPAGAQLLCLHLARTLTDHFGFHVNLVSLGEGKLMRQYADSCTLDYVPVGKMTPESTLSFAKALKNRGVSLALVNTSASGKIIPIFKEVGITCVSLIHELPLVLSGRGLKEHVHAIARHADKIVFAAPQVKDGFESFLGHSVFQAVIRPQGVYQRSWLRTGLSKDKVRENVRLELGLPLGAKIIMSAGYGDRRKGFDLFVEIGVRLMKSRSDSWFLWVGNCEEGFDEASLAVADRAGLRGRFLFTGFVDEPQPYYLAADIYALTSREDPFPSVVMEALEALTPVVAFKDTGGFEELLVRECGVLVQKEDVTAFSEALNVLLKAPERAQVMAQTGRNIVEREFSLRHYIFDLLELGEIFIPRVSVIVPNYNYGRYLSDRLSSVVGQTLPLFELIVLDDCSTDDSLAVASDFLEKCDVPWELAVNKVNSGSVFKQWRKGLEMARGEYVWIAEADDESFPTFLEQITHKMHQTEAVIGFCDSWQIDEEGKRLGDSYKHYVNEYSPGSFNQSFVLSGRDFLVKHLAVKNVILNVSGAVFRRANLLQAMEKLGGDLFQFKVAGDWRLYVELCLTDHPVVYEVAPLNGHRRHTASVTHAMDERRHMEEINYLHNICRTVLGNDLVEDDQFNYRNDVQDYLHSHNAKTSQN